MKNLKFMRGMLVSRKFRNRFTDKFTPGAYCVLGAVGKALGKRDGDLDLTSERSILRLAKKKFKFKSRVPYNIIIAANDSGNWKFVNKWLRECDDLWNRVKKFAKKG